jgi:hypothetical protein
MFLVFVNELGPNYRGDNIYEFIFSDEVKDVWGDMWDSKPSNGYPSPPEIKFIKKVGILKNDKISLSVIQNSDYFSMIDAIDDVIALAWENENESINFDLVKRLVFRYGDTEEIIKNKLYERDIVLEFEKKLNYEFK